MKNIRGQKQFKILIFVLIAVITLGIGYAGITAINLVVNGTGSVTASRDNFKVKFKTASITTGEGSANITSDTTATFSVSGLTKEKDQAVATYTIKNESNGVGAEISLGIENTNSEYFKVTECVEDTELQAGDITTTTITVELIKTPIDENPTTTITGTLTAKPRDNASTVGNDSSSKQIPTAFAQDSWATIKANVQAGNTSQYDIGDTKIVEINDTEYTVRIANKTINENCNNSNYSETACGFVVEFMNIITKMAMHDNQQTNSGGYQATDVYNYLKNTLYGQLPEDLQSAIQSTRVISGYGDNGEDNHNFVTNDKIYLLSGVEVFGSDSNDTAASTTVQLEYYAGKSTYYKVKQYINSNTGYWLRSAHAYSVSAFLTVDAYGFLRHSNTANANGVVPAFRIG